MDDQDETGRLTLRIANISREDAGVYQCGGSTRQILHVVESRPLTRYIEATNQHTTVLHLVTNEVVRLTCHYNYAAKKNKSVQLKWIYGSLPVIESEASYHADGDGRVHTYKHLTFIALQQYNASVVSCRTLVDGQIQLTDSKIELSISEFLIPLWMLWLTVSAVTVSVMLIILCCLMQLCKGDSNKKRKEIDAIDRVERAEEDLDAESVKDLNWLARLLHRKVVGKKEAEPVPPVFHIFLKDSRISREDAVFLNKLMNLYK